MMKNNKSKLTKESKQERLARIQNQKFLGTQLMVDKKYSRKEKHKRNFEDYKNDR